MLNSVDCAEVAVDRLEGDSLNYAIAVALKMKVESFNDAFLKNAKDKGYEHDHAVSVLVNQPLYGKFCVRDGGIKLHDITDYTGNPQAAHAVISELRQYGLKIEAHSASGWVASLSGGANVHSDELMYVAALKCFVEKKLGKAIRVPVSLLAPANKLSKVKL